MTEGNTQSKKDAIDYVVATHINNLLLSALLTTQSGRGEPVLRYKQQHTVKSFKSENYFQYSERSRN